MAGVTEGYLYFIESEVAQQNWLAGGASTIELTNFTEVTHYCKIERPEDFQKRFKTGISVSYLGGASFDVMWDNKSYNLLPYGFKTSIENAEKVEQFFMADRHTSSNTTTFKQYYLVVKYTTTKFVEFYDFNNNRLTYCKGLLIDGSIIWSDTESLIAYVRLNFYSTW